jgi:L-fucose isomerase
MAENRLIGDYPVIGIRPTIDGRRGPMRLRESLEDQTMALANAAKKQQKKAPSKTEGGER